jgi:hypothetical protein
MWRMTPSMTRRILSTAIAVVALAVMPLASAYVPDPIWIAGIWDGGDADGLVAVLSGADGLTDREALTPVRAAPRPAESPQMPSARVVLNVVFLPDNRAPPPA